MKRVKYILTIPLFVLFSLIVLTHKAIKFIFRLASKLTRFLLKNSIRVILFVPWFCIIRPILVLIGKVLICLKVRKGQWILDATALDNDPLGYTKRTTILHEMN